MSDDDIVYFVSFGICFLLAAYQGIKTKNIRLLYGVVLGVSALSMQAPFNVPLEFVFSFNGLLGFAVVLYKRISQKLHQSFIFLGIFLLITGNIFLLQHFFSPEHAPLWIFIEYGFGLCSFLMFGFLLYKILLKKIDRNFIIFDLLLLIFGISLLSRAFIFSDQAPQFTFWSSHSYSPDILRASR